MTMLPRRSDRIKRKPDRFVDKSAKNGSDTKPETVSVEGRRSEPVASGRGRGRQRSDSPWVVSQARSDPTVAPGNNMQDLAGPYSPVNEVSGLNNIADSVEMGVNDLKVALKATRDEFASYMYSVTGVLCSLFGVLTSTQITEIENANGEALKDDALFNKCINQAKNYAAIRERTYKDALVDENKREKTKHSGNAQSTPVSFAQTRDPQGRRVPTARAVLPLVNAQAAGVSRANNYERGMNKNEINEPPVQTSSAGQRDND